MSKNKSSTLTLRIDPKFNDSLRVVALNEHRSIANMIVVLIRDYCEHNGNVICERHSQITTSIDENELNNGA